MTGRPGLLDAAVLARGRPYVERAEPEAWVADKVAEALVHGAAAPVRALRGGRALRAIVAATDAHEAALRAVSDAELLALARAMRSPMRAEGFSLTLAGRSFALVREAAARTLGLRHFDTQLMAGWALLQDRLVEMHTGEGKSLAATLAAATVALAGYRMHVITVNGYLAERDAEAMAPLYGMLGIGVAAVTQRVPREGRAPLYRKPVVYCDNKELAFDYLRDRLAAGPKASRQHRAVAALSGGRRRDPMILAGLEFAIVDEADSVLVDEARTPLILSASRDTEGAAALAAQALAIAEAMAADRDYVCDPAERRVALTRAGRARLADVAVEGWASARAQEEMVVQALTALHLFHRDTHYVVAEGTVQIVDESTGRIMPDRSWERGLHQLIELKEGCAPTLPRETIARITYQRLFRRYVHLSGMTGTAMEVAGEIRRIYRLETVRIPLHRPSRRQYWPARLVRTRAEKWAAVAGAAGQLALGQGRPVLIGTRSVGASEEISAVLAAAGVPHALLNAKQDRDEAAVIAAAGGRGRVTVATNMAGRGTDILLGEGVEELGGLHVILTEYHEQRRVDRQLFGRCARQGNPGSCEAIVSLEDEVFATYAPGAAAWAGRLPGRLPAATILRLLRMLAQRRAETRSAAIRLGNLETDLRMDATLAFSGRGE